MKNLMSLFALFLFAGCSIPADDSIKFETQDFSLSTPITLTRNTEIEQQGANTVNKMYGKSVDVKLYSGSGNNCMMMVSSTNYHSKLTKDNLIGANVGSILNVDKTQPIEDIVSRINFRTENDILYSKLEYSTIKKGYNILMNSGSCLSGESIHSVMITCQDTQHNRNLSKKIVESFKCK